MGEMGTPLDETAKETGTEALERVRPVRRRAARRRAVTGRMRGGRGG